MKKIQRSFIGNRTEPAKGHARKKIVSRAHEIYLVRTRYDLFSCLQEIKVVSRAHEIVSRGHEILSRAHEIRFFFLHVPSRAP